MIVKIKLKINKKNNVFLKDNESHKDIYVFSSEESRISGFIYIYFTKRVVSNPFSLLAPHFLLIIELKTLRDF